MGARMNRFSSKKRQDSEFRIIIAGGGTGGHLFPGIAVAREVQTRFRNAGILFVVGRKKVETEILSTYQFQTESIDVKGLKGQGWKQGFHVLIRIPRSILQSATIIRRFSPSVVLGVGGYSSGPFCLTAKGMGIKTAIHEQNSYPGLTNRLLARMVDRTFISFAACKPFLKSKRTVLTGNPVRGELLLNQRTRPKNRKTFCVLVVGGSQGARAVNEAFVEALAQLKTAGKKVRVIHQTGEVDFERVHEEYANRGLTGEVVPFIKEMAEAYRFADMVVSRAGATTIFELAALGKPSVLIPYPFAANQHQETNANALVGIGGAEMLHQKDLNGESLGRVLMKYMNDRPALQKMGERAGRIYRPDAAKRIVDELEALRP